MKIQIRIILLIFVSTSAIYSQSVFFKVNYNFSDMSDLEKMQNELLQDMIESNIPAEKMESYPAYFGFQFGLLFPLRNNADISLGGFFDYASTGGRIHYQDYSGEVKADQIADAYSLAGQINFEKQFSEIFSLNYPLSIRLIMSNFTNHLLFQIGTEKQSEELSFTSTSLGIEGGIIPTINLSNLKIGLSISYLLNIPTSLEYEDDVFLTFKNGDKVTINWSGFKFGLMLKYRFI